MLVASSRMNSAASVAAKRIVNLLGRMVGRSEAAKGCAEVNHVVRPAGPLPRDRGSSAVFEATHAAVALVLLLAAAVLTGAAALRGFEYDEAYSIFVTSAAPRPAWPVIPFSAGSVRSAYQADASLSAVARALRQTDVHPPLYFWALALWRRAVGSSYFAARMLSVLFGLGALAAIAGIARLVRIPAAPAMLFSLGSTDLLTPAASPAASRWRNC